MGRCGDNTSCTQQDSAISLLCTPATNDHDCLIMTLDVQVASLGQLCNLSCTTASSLEHDTAYTCAFMGLANMVKAGCVHLCRVARNIVWSHMAKQVTPDSSEMLSGKSNVTDVTFDVLLERIKLLWKIMAKSNCQALWYTSTSVTVLYKGIVISR